eukprot:scaffold195885_cov27-Tisochrysis_lutea.AAC.2
MNPTVRFQPVVREAGADLPLQEKRLVFYFLLVYVMANNGPRHSRMAFVARYALIAPDQIARCR